MPSLFVVITKTEKPQLCVSQKDLTETCANLKSWPYSHTHQLYVFEPRVLPSSSYGSSQYGQPSGCAELAMVARIDPTDKIENYQFMLGHELDQLPPEQAVLRTQQAIDHLSRKLAKFENSNVVVEEVNNAG